MIQPVNRHIEQPRVAPQATLHHKPWLIGFLVFLISTLPAYSVLPGPLKSNGSPAKLLALALFSVVALGFVAGTHKRSHPRFPISAIFVLYVLIGLLIFGVSESHTTDDHWTAGNVRGLLVTIASAGVAMYTIARVKRDDRDFVLGCLAIGLTFNCIVALLHSQFNIDLRFIFQPPGFVQNLVTEDQAQLQPRFGVLRAVGTSGHPIEFSVLAAASVPMTIYFSRFAQSKTVRILAALATPVNCLAMAASVSRTGIIALISALLVFVWAFPIRQLAGGLVVGFGIVTATIGVTPKNAAALWSTITNSTTDPSVLARIAVNAKVSQTFRENPIFGIGSGGAEPTEYGFIDNQWLLQIVQGGVFGLLAISIIAVAAVAGFTLALREVSTPRSRFQVYAIGAGLAGIVSTTFTFDLLSYQQVNFVLFLLISLLWVDSGLHLDERYGYNSRPDSRV